MDVAKVCEVQLGGGTEFEGVGRHGSTLAVQAVAVFEERLASPFSP